MSVNSASYQISKFQKSDKIVSMDKNIFRNSSGRETY